MKGNVNETTCLLKILAKVCAQYETAGRSSYL